MAKTETDRGGRPAEAGGPAPDIPGLSTRRTSSATGMIIKIILLGLVLALAIFGVIPLIADGRWLWVAILVVVTAIMFFVYLSPRVIPLKYLLPGTILLLAFVVYPVIGTAAVAFTNFGDGHRGTKEEAIDGDRGGVGSASRGLDGLPTDSGDGGRPGHW